MAWSEPELKPRNPKDDQVYRIVDVSSPAKPRAVGRWHLPGTMEGDDAPPPARLPANFDAGFRAHNTNVYPQRPDRCYLGYIDGGIMVLDISEPSRPKLVSRWSNSPPYNGFNHTVLPLFERGLVVVSDESVRDNGADWPKLVWILDARDEPHLVSISPPPPPPGRASSGHDPPPAPAAGRSLQGPRRALRRPQPARESAGAGRLEVRDD